MGGFMGTVRRKVAAGAVGAALLGVGVGFGAHAAANGPTVTRPASDTAAVSTSSVTAPTSSVTAPTSSVTAPTPAPTTVTVVEQPGADTQAATVGQVSTEPAADSTPAEQPSTEPAPGGGLVAIPAPTSVPTAPKLPGEPGYQADNG